MCRHHRIGPARKAKADDWEGLAPGFKPPNPAPIRRVVGRYLRQLGAFTASKAAKFATTAIPTDATKAAKSVRTLWDQSGYDASDLQKQLVPVVAPIYERVQESQRAKYDRIRVNAGMAPVEVLTVSDPRLVQAVSSLSLALAESTLNTAAMRADKAIEEARIAILTGAVTGRPATAIAKAIRATFTGLASWGAHRIARTEVVRAYHDADRLSAIESGVVTQWEWLASSDACPRCLELNGRRVGLRESFGDSGSRNPAYSATPHPPLHPHCGCTVIPIIDPTLMVSDGDESEDSIAEPEPIVAPRAETIAPRVTVPSVVAPPKPALTGQALIDQAASDLEDAFDRINERSQTKNFVPLWDLRAELKQYDRATQDAAIQKLRLDWTYSLEAHEGLHYQLTPEQAEATIMEGPANSPFDQIRLAYISRRPDATGGFARRKPTSDATPPPPAPPPPSKPIAPSRTTSPPPVSKPSEPPQPTSDPLAYLPKDFNPAKLTDEEWAKYVTLSPKEFAAWYLGKRRTKAFVANARHEDATVNDDMIAIGSAVKAMPDGTLGGYLVRFTGPDDPDTEGEYFTRRTDFWGPPPKAGVVFHHGFAKGLGKRRIGWAELACDDQGVSIKATLDPTAPGRDKIIAAAKSGKLGWSSGSATHLVEKSGGEIRQWPIIEASLTYTPVDPKARVIPLKAILPKAPVVKADAVVNAPKTLAELENLIAHENFDPSDLPVPIKALVERLTRIVERLESAAKVERIAASDPGSQNEPTPPESDQAERLRRVVSARLAVERALASTRL